MVRVQYIQLTLCTDLIAQIPQAVISIRQSLLTSISINTCGIKAKNVDLIMPYCQKVSVSTACVKG